MFALLIAASALLAHGADAACYYSGGYYNWYYNYYEYGYYYCHEDLEDAAATAAAIYWTCVTLWFVLMIGGCICYCKARGDYQKAKDKASKARKILKDKIHKAQHSGVAMAAPMVGTGGPTFATTHTVGQ